MNTKLLKISAVALIGMLLAIAARADRVELTNGSTVVGKIVSAEDGKFKVDTDFAGTIEIKQDKIKSFATDEAVNVGLKAGSAVQGKVQSDASGMQVVASTGALSTNTEGVTAVWKVGDDSPETRKAKEAAKKLARQWAYEASFGITGRTGGAEKFSGVLAFKATLESSQDKLIFNLQAEKAEDNGVETANRQLAGVDYSSFFSEKNVWYARTSLEKDEIKLLDLRSTTAFGVGRKLIKKEKQDLEFRYGLSYLYETYANGDKFDSPGLDFALLHTYQFANGKLTNAITYTPTFDDFGNYRVHHESSYEMPITASQWKLKLGLTNDYTSVPQPGVDRLDTLYFTSLILNWK